MSEQNTLHAVVTLRSAIVLASQKVVMGRGAQMSGVFVIAMGRTW